MIVDGFPYPIVSAHQGERRACSRADASDAFVADFRVELVERAAAPEVSSEKATVRFAQYCVLEPLLMREPPPVRRLSQCGPGNGRSNRRLRLECAELVLEPSPALPNVLPDNRGKGRQGT